MNRPFIDSSIELKYIPEISGWGVFAVNNINTNTILETSPVVVYPKRLMDMAIWCCQAEGIQNKDFKFDQYALLWKEDCAMPLGWAGMYNHKDFPNCIFVSDYENSLLSVKAIQPIPAGEQLFVSYGEHWFKQKGYVTKYEF